MESSEGVISSVKKWLTNRGITVTPSSRTPETQEPVSRWDYETFKHFLLAQARGPEFLLPINEFPEEVEISQGWHDTFNTMRDAADRDRVERLALVGHSQTKRAIYLPTRTFVSLRFEKERFGERGQAVHPMLLEIQKNAILSSDAEGISGLLHSHPFTPGFRDEGLSSGDLYMGGFYGTFIGVAEGPINSIAFKTRDSSMPREEFHSFVNFWQGQSRFGDQARISLAEKYSIALYKGKKDEPLRRIYPGK